VFARVDKGQQAGAARDGGDDDDASGGALAVFDDAVDDILSMPQVPLARPDGE
jgi:hypothetical protein